MAASMRALGDALAGIVPEHRRSRRPARLHSGLTADVREAVRSLRQTPTFTTVALIVLALGIGAGTAIFSVVDAVVLRGLPFDEPDRIVAVLEDNPRRPGYPGSTMPQNYLDWQAQQRSFSAMAALNRMQFRVRNAAGGLDNVRGLRVSSGFFDVLRVRPAIGRPFLPEDEVQGRDHIVVLSDAFWSRRFGGDPDIVGKTIEINKTPWTIAGVMPRTFSYPVGSAQPADLFTPLAFSAVDRSRSGPHNYQYLVVARLADETRIARASDDMNRLAAAVDAQNAGWNTLNPGGRVRVVTLQEYLVGRVRTWMLMLLGSVVLLLLIACANVANLMLARASVRGRETGIRAALGATRWRLARALLVEGVVLSLGAAVLGVLVAGWGVQILKAWMPDNIPRVANIAIDLRVLAATIAAAASTGILFGMVPALQVRPDLTAVLRGGGRAATAGAAAHRLRSLLVVAEVALALVLVVGAGLFGESFLKLVRIEPGFDYRGVLALGVNVVRDSGTFEDVLDQGGPYVDRMLEAVAGVHGVEEVAAVSGGLPLSGGRVSNSVTVRGHDEFTGSDEIDVRSVTPNYLQLLRVPLVEGRGLTRDDRRGSPLVAVVNQSAARRYWQGADPIGEPITIDKKTMTVVGIVGDIRHGGPEIPPRPEVYMPIAQDRVGGATLVMRTEGDPIDALPAVEMAIWSVNRDQTLYTDRVTLEAYMDGLIAPRRFNMALLTLFGALGLVISAVGVYGVMAYIVSQRTKEIGVRMALGASRRAVVKMVLGSAGTLVLAGLGIGTVGAWYASSVASAFLFQLDARDPRAFAGAIVCLAMAAAVATLVPAGRAASVDPIVALRAE